MSHIVVHTQAARHLHPWLVRNFKGRTQSERRRIFCSPHAEMRAKERDIDVHDLVRAINSGTSDGTVFMLGDTRLALRLELSCGNGRELAVVIAARGTYSLEIVTVMWRDC